MLRTLTDNWIVIEAALATVPAPLAAVALARRTRSAAAGVWVFIACDVLFAAACGAISRFQPAGATWATIAQTQAVVASAVLGLGAVGACASALFSDVLDAAGVSLALVLVLSGGVFVAGGPLADWSAGVLNAALVASPIVSAAAAANIDLFRSAFLYEHSPIGHRLFAYPSWYAASGLYLATAGVLLISRTGVIFRLGRRSSAPHQALPETRRTASPPRSASRS
jgi:hypothetical protein